MKLSRIVGCSIIVAMLAVTCMYALTAMLEQPNGPPKRILFISGGTSESWRRAAVGARAAAHDFGVELCVKTPTADDRLEEQSAMVHEISNEDYDGVAFCPIDSESQIDLINELAGRTKLVTVGKSVDMSKGLCHVGFCQRNAGGRVAWLTYEALPRGGKVALVCTDFSDIDRNMDVCERLDGFKEQWAELNQSASSILCPNIIRIPDRVSDDTPMAESLRSTLADPDLAFIVAFDAHAAESALAAFAQLPQSQNARIISFDPTAEVLDAIEDGRVYCAINDDSYRNGYEGVKELASLCRSDASQLPMPGHGIIPLMGEVVQKSNLSDFRRRAQSRPVSMSHYTWPT